MINSDKFIKEDLNKYVLMKYLENKLDDVGLANVDIQRTPLVTRISLEVLNPARIIGRRGKLINDLTASIKSDFNIENPQISVVEIKNPFLEPRIVAKKATRYIELGKKVRSVLHFFLGEIINSGALGAEIVAAGKIGAKGARAKTLRVSKGHIPKSGEPIRLVREAHINANTRSGVIGILVRIMPPGAELPVPKPKYAKHKRVRVDLEEPGKEVKESDLLPEESTASKKEEVSEKPVMGKEVSEQPVMDQEKKSDSKSEETPKEQAEKPKKTSKKAKK